MIKNASGVASVAPERLRALIVASAVCANLFVAAFSAYSLSLSRQQAELRAQTRTQNITQAVAPRLSNSIEKIDLALRAITDEFELGRSGGIVFRDAGLGLAARHPPLAGEPAGIVGNKIFSAELRALAASGVGSEDYLADWYTEVYKTAAWFVGFVLLSILASYIVLYLLRRMVEESLRNERYLKHAGDGIHILDESGNVLQASDRFCAMLGYERSEIIGMNLTQWDAHGSAEGASGKLLPEFLHKLETSTFEARHRRKDGELIDVEVTVSGIDLDGKPLLYAASREIGERKRIEAAERRQRESLASLNRISALSHLPFAEQLQQALGIGAAHLGLELGIVSHVVDGACTIVAQVSPANTLHHARIVPCTEICCQITIAQEGVVVIPEVGLPPDSGEGRDRVRKLEIYIGAPVFVRDEVFGTVNFSSPTPCWRSFDDGDKEFISLLARWVGSAIERNEAQTELAASEQRLHAIIENEPECVKVLGPEGNLLQMNRAGLAMLEAESVDAVNDYGLINFVVAEHRQAFLDLGLQVFHGHAGTLEFEVVGQCGTRRWLETHAAPLRDVGGKVVSLLAVTRDITDRQHAESELRLAASVFNHAYEGIVICDAQQIILEVNPTFSEITGYAREEVLGQPTKLLGSNEHSPEFYQSMWQAIETRGFWEGEVWKRRKDGTAYAELLSISQVRDKEGKITHYIGTFSDISAFKMQQAQLEYLAHYDALTSLPNRTLFSDRMAQSLSQAKRSGALVAVGYLDLDGFKAINDEFGHDAGDDLLIEVARRLTETLRTADTVARLGGDEFVLLLPGVGCVKECELAARRVLAVLAEPINVKGHERRISGSLGITIFPIDDSDTDALLRHADQAMYLAKRRGKNRFVLSSHTKPAMQSPVKACSQ